MPLRCLLFSSHEEMVEPIWQVLSDLGIEGEYCRSAVDAVEKVTTQPFQIVITDWDDQPEAAFLLKTARDLKAAQRPLTLAIVSDDARLPEALQAGANSVLAKPIRPDQVRDTMSTACQLLRAKQQPSAPHSGAAATPRPAPDPGRMAVAAAAAVSTATPEAPVAEKTFRAKESLPSLSSAAGAQFDKEPAVKPADDPSTPKVDARAAMEPRPPATDSSAQQPNSQEPLTGWAMLQARLNAPVFGTGKANSTNGELLSYGETPSYGARRAESSREEVKAPAKPESKQEEESEAALFAYMSRKAKQAPAPEPLPQPGRGKILLFVALVIAGAVLAAVPQTRQSLLMLYRNTVRAGSRLLNPPPPPLPQAVPQHDSFGQSGDEYKLPVVGNIPDATTDPSQIQVLPVVDPTAKPEKGSDTSSGQAQGTAVENKNPVDQTQTAPVQSPQGQIGTSVIKDPSTSVGNVPEKSTSAAPDSFLSPKPAQPPQFVVPQSPVAPPLRISPPAHTASTGGSSGIPSSLRSQIASTTPESSGAKPAEAAMSSIEPVNLPESAARELLTQPVDPEYPAGAKASGQRGTVVLQVLIGRDGTVQDAKFLQGSLVFARVAIDAARQWRFKPYSMNGRPVSVQSTITLTFKPPA